MNGRLDDLAVRARLAALPGAALVLSGPTIVAAARAASALLGDDPVGRRLADLVDPGDRPKVASALAGDGPVVVSLALERRCRIEIAATDEDDDGLAAVILVDRTAERTASAMIDALADVTLVVDAEGIVSYESGAAAASAERAGHDRELQVGESRALALLHPEDLPGVLEELAWLLAHPGDRRSAVVRALSPDGDSRWRMVRLDAVSAVDQPDLAGVVVQVTLLDDVGVHPSVGTGSPFESLAEVAPVGIVVADGGGREVYRNAVVRRLIGGAESPLAVVLPAEDWRDAASDEDRPVLDALVAAAVAGRRPEPVTCRLRGPSGVTCARVEVQPRLVDGAVVGVIATLLDVSAEVEARESAERLTQMLDAVPDLVAIWRPDGGEYLYLNRAVRRSLDLHAAASDDGSSRLSDLMSPADLAQFTELALETLEESNTWTGELTIKVTPDVAVPMWSVGVIRRGTDGEIEWAGMMARNISRLKEAESELRRLAEHDDLTGLPNRKALLEVVGEAVETLDEGPSVALVFCDLDGFKAINDVHGHAVGDQALSVLGRRLSGAVRSGDVAARVGGDEFVVLCRDADDEEAVAALAERIIATLAAPVSVAGFEVQVGSSLGIARAAVGTTDLDADRLLSAADTAMYRAKAMGGNRFRIVAME